MSLSLFFAPGASSLAAHILLREAEIPFTLERVDLIAKLWSGGHYDQINPKLYVPALMLPSGDVLTEGNIILQYISDHAPSKHLLPANHDLDRYRALEWLNFIGMEIHKNFITRERHGGVAANFLAKTRDGQAFTRELVTPRLSYVARHLETRSFLLGDHFSAPDAYFFVMLTWAGRLALDIGHWPSLTAFFERVKSRPAVAATLQIEGPPHSLTPEG